MKKNAIITFSDSKYGDFLANHWIKSLKDNVNLDNIDVVVLDYGLNKEQINKIEEGNIKIIRCKRDGKVVIIRFRDILNFLKKNKYAQVMSCDGGDIIFQKDISHLFYENKKDYRAVCEFKLPFNEWSALQGSIDKNIILRLKKYNSKKMINAGVVIAPRVKFMRFCRMCNTLITDKNKFGPDQIIANYLFYKEGFIELENTYNFIPGTANDGFLIRNGEFYYRGGEKIAIVHNAGQIKFNRVINNFGYGVNFNKLKFIRYYFFRMLILFLNKFYYKTI
jgi:hypothetical protein